MPKYLSIASFSQEGLKGTLKEGGTKRRDAVGRAIESLGGKLEAFYYAFGEDDAYVIAEMPDNVAAAATSVTVAASGATSKIRTVVLITPEEMDEVSKRQIAYRPPGG